MADTHILNVQADDRALLTLARFEMDPQDCIGEIIDNSIAAKVPTKKCHINLYLIGSEGSNLIDVYVADDGIGMDLEGLRNALTLGGKSRSKNRLNEHGFGLKNALATATLEKPKNWAIWTSKTHGDYFKVKGPLKQTKEYEENAQLPHFISKALQNQEIPPVSTLIYFQTTKNFLRGLSRKGGQATNIEKFGEYLVEHLGVKYRGFLKSSGNKHHYEINIRTIAYSKNKEQQQRLLPVYEISVPFGHIYQKFSSENSGEIILKKGQKIKWEVQEGTVDQQRVKELVKIGVLNHEDKTKTTPAKYYYQGDQTTQGIDIEVNGRTIATAVIDPIWNIARHNSLNDFVGVLKLTDVPQGCLATRANKTSFDKHDADWNRVFAKIRENKKLIPQKNGIKRTEAMLRDIVVDEINNVNQLTEDPVKAEAEYTIGDTGIRADIVVSHNNDNKQVEIVECKVGTGTDQDLAQLQYYCQQMVDQANKQPTKAILLCDRIDEKLKTRINRVNSFPRPSFPDTNKEAEPFNYVVEDAKKWWKRAEKIREAEDEKD